MCFKAINNLYFTKIESTEKQNTESTVYIKINVLLSVVELNFNIMWGTHVAALPGQQKRLQKGCRKAAKGLQKGCKRAAESLQKDCRKAAKRLQKGCRKAAKRLQKGCRKAAKRLQLPLGCSWRDQTIRCDGNAQQYRAQGHVFFENVRELKECRVEIILCSAEEALTKQFTSEPKSSSSKLHQRVSCIVVDESYTVYTWTGKRLVNFKNLMRQWPFDSLAGFLQPSRFGNIFWKWDPPNLQPFCKPKWKRLEHFPGISLFWSFPCATRV